jgi:hypothetical protein
VKSISPFQLVDEDMLIPVIGMWIFADRKFDSQDTAGHLYFQDVESYPDWNNARANGVLSKR